MKRLSACLLLAVLLMTLGGCWDKRELEDNVFAVLLGIDAAQDDEICLTVAFPLTQAGGEEGYTVLSARAHTLVEGLSLLNTKLSGPLALYSVKTIVISEQMARGDMLRQVLSSWRNEEIRGTTNVLISQCDAAQFIAARVQDPLIEPLRQEELLPERVNDSAYYKPIQLLDLLTNLKSDSGGGVAAYGGISVQEDGEKAVRTGYLPDQAPITARNETLISGLAVFRGARMVGTLDSFEAQLYSMLAGGGGKKVLALPDPLAPGYDIVVSILPAGRRGIRSSTDGAVPTVSIALDLNCTLESIQSGVDYTAPQNHAALTEHIRTFCATQMKALIAKTQQQFDADILRLGDKLARHFPTVSAWEDYDWQARYQDTEITLRVELEIEHSGILMP